MKLTDFMVNDESVIVFVRKTQERATAEIMYAVTLVNPNSVKYRGYRAIFEMDMALSLNDKPHIEYSEEDWSKYYDGTANYVSGVLKEYYEKMVK